MILNYGGRIARRKIFVKKFFLIVCERENRLLRADYSTAATTAFLLWRFFPLLFHLHYKFFSFRAVAEKFAKSLFSGFLVYFPAARHFYLFFIFRHHCFGPAASCQYYSHSNLNLFRRAEFTTTVSELSAIAAAATMGLRYPSAARGIAAEL